MMMKGEVAGQKCFVTVKMHRQLYKEHLGLQKSFCDLYHHMTNETSPKNALNWICEKNKLEAMVNHFKTKALELQRKLEDANERCELLEFCLLEWENQAAEVCNGKDYGKEDESIALKSTAWERNILNKCYDCNHSFPKIMNSDANEIGNKTSSEKATMESESYRLQLEGTQKKLTDLTEQLDSVLQCNCKLGVGMDYVIATVNELQSLMKWTAEKAEIKADSAVIFQKLQQLERIQKDLEKTAIESEEIRTLAEQERPQALPNERTSTDECSTSPLQNAPEISDTNSNEDTMILLDNALQKIELLSSTKPSQSFEERQEEKLLIDLDTPEAVDIQTENTSPLGTSPSKHKNSNCESHDSLGTNISEDEGLGEESRRGDSTGPSSYVEIQDLSNLPRVDTGLQYPLSSEIIVTDPDGIKNIQVWANENKDQTSTLDMCLCAIGNLRESLRTKENELLKLSALQNDQKQIAELQDVIINFHKDTTSLKSELNQTRKENASLKEQVLELEEAENDARLQAQKLGEKLVFLQEKDNHFQAKLCETKLALEKCVDKLNRKETEERELRSQMKYMEALVQKYEDQIRTMEIVELALRKKLIEEDEIRVKEQSQVQKVDRGTQMYELPSSNSQTCDIRDTFSEKSEKIFSATSSGRNTPCSFYSNKLNSKKIVDTCVQVPDEGFIKFMFADCSVQTENTIFNLNENRIDSKSIAIQNSSRGTASTGRIEGSNPSAISSIECPIQDELLKRLHQLVEEDAHLQQQLHYVDQINLTLWKKLHNLEFHIGECKKRNVSEDGASDSCIDSESEFLSSRPVSREQMRDESSATSICASPCTNRGIIACLDQSEHEIRERLSKLEEINSSFEKELEMREKLYLEKEKKYSEWVQTEQTFIGDLKRLSDERDSLVSQVDQLQKDKEELTARVLVLQTEIDRVNERHQKETEEIRQEQEDIITQLQQIVDTLLTKEKDHLKQITNLKLEKSKPSDKNESDQLKSSYVELQLELSRTRDEMRKREEDFRIRLDESRSKHVMEEARLISELEMLREKGSHFDQMINGFQLRQNELVNIVKQKECELDKARQEYKKSMEVTEEEHRAIEAELKRQLRKMEEGTSVATRALTEERMRLEKELQENIDDLRSKEEVYKARISELESNVTHLHEELHRITSDLDSGFGSPDGAYNYRREKLQNQLRDLRDREIELREKLDEMEQKEAAYRETLEHADRIVASVEQGYKNKIEELEISEKNLKQRVMHLEEVESRLRGALHKERRSSDGRKPDDLVLELLEAEAREIGLKEKVQTLEQLSRSSMNKVKDLEKIREKLETQLSDKEELTNVLQKTQQELDNARKSLAKLKKSEAELKSSLQHTESILANTESQMRNKIRIIDEEKKGLEETIDELRAQVRELKRKLEKISNEREEQRISVTIPKQIMTPLSIAAAINDPNDEPDYADVDECCPHPQQITVKPLPFQNQAYPKKSTITASATLTNMKPATLPKDNKFKQVQQPVSPHPSDTFIDNARQNLEDCMLRAMAAMKSDMKKKVTNEQATEEENDYDEVLPRPTNLRIVQQVGSDTLLVGWNYVNTSLLEGFEVYVDGHLHETVYTPDRTKALISGLNLKRPLRLSICALSRYGQMSDPTVLELPIQGKNGYKYQGDDEEEDENENYENKRPYSMEW